MSLQDGVGKPAQFLVMLMFALNPEKNLNKKKKAKIQAK